MGFWRTTRKMVGHVVDLRVDHWCDIQLLKKSTLFFWDQLCKLFTSEKPTHSESFEEAVYRLGLTPEAVTKQSHRYLLLTLFFFLVALGLLIYTSILIYLKNWMGVCISFSLSLYAFSLLFRFYFWYFQITHKKLGCSVREWYQTISLPKRISQQ